MVFRHRARARHRGIDKSDQRAKSATTADPYPRTNSHLKGDSPLHAPTRRLPPHSPLAGSHSPPLVFPLALFMFRLGTRVARLGTAVATRGSDSEPGAATRQGDSDTREAPRGGEGDDSLLRVARAGADSPLRDAPRHYRVRRHFLRGPFLLGISGFWISILFGSFGLSATASSARRTRRTSPFGPLDDLLPGHL